jgi:hypothetical protein
MRWNSGGGSSGNAVSPDLGASLLGQGFDRSLIPANLSIDRYQCIRYAAGAGDQTCVRKCNRNRNHRLHRRARRCPLL